EFMGEGRRLDDLRRWHKGNYVDRQPTGVWVNNASADKVKVTGGANSNEGYVYYYGQPTGWKEYYYLCPLPLEELALNKNLEQNPEWSKSNK
ncbi:RagB/SusD family nutrient uptake outer membrane protein, partial [uncultured Prevotella sp.]